MPTAVPHNGDISVTKFLDMSQQQMENGQQMNIISFL